MKCYLNEWYWGWRTWRQKRRGHWRRRCSALGLTEFEHTNVLCVGDVQISRWILGNPGKKQINFRSLQQCGARLTGTRELTEAGAAPFQPTGFPRSARRRDDAASPNIASCILSASAKLNQLRFHYAGLIARLACRRAAVQPVAKSREGSRNDPAGVLLPGC